MCLEESKETIALMCMDDHPNLPALPSEEWDYWLFKIYGLWNFTPRNTLWIHLAVWDKKYTYAFAEILFSNIFTQLPLIEYIMMVTPPGTDKIDWLELHGARVLPAGK